MVRRPQNRTAHFTVGQCRDGEEAPLLKDRFGADFRGKGIHGGVANERTIRDLAVVGPLAVEVAVVHFAVTDLDRRVLHDRVFA